MTKKILGFFSLAVAIVALSVFLTLGARAEDSSTCSGNLTTYYYDGDGDGYGSSTVTVLACSAPKNYVSTSTDCNDNNAKINPAATEICNGLDDDCDGVIDDGLATTTYYLDFDGDGYGTTATTTAACSKPTGYSATSTDCDDTNSLIFSSAKEICDSIDNNCNGTIDENCHATSTSIFYRDGDGDSYGDAKAYVIASSAPTGYVLNKKDCNDANASIYPGATEICNGLDDDCDGVKDEGCSNNAYPCAGYLFKNHGSYVSCVSHWLNELRDQQRARSQEKIKAAQEKAWERYNKRWDDFWDKMIKQMNKIKERGKIKK